MTITLQLVAINFINGNQIALIAITVGSFANGAGAYIGAPPRVPQDVNGSGCRQQVSAMGPKSSTVQHHRILSNIFQYHLISPNANFCLFYMTFNDL